jgi:hypothetical protein
MGLPLESIVKKFTPLHETEYFSREADSLLVGEQLPSFYITKV